MSTLVNMREFYALPDPPAPLISPTRKSLRKGIRIQVREVELIDDGDHEGPGAL
jgi:hypothetical protein